MNKNTTFRKIDLRNYMSKITGIRIYLRILQKLYIVLLEAHLEIMN